MVHREQMSTGFSSTADIASGLARSSMLLARTSRSDRAADSACMIACETDDADHSTKTTRPVSGARIQLYAACPERLGCARLCLGDSLEKSCKSMRPIFPKRFLSPLILLAALASLGGANFPTQILISETRPWR